MKMELTKVRIEEAMDKVFRIEESEKTLRERVDLTLREKMKFYFSRRFREEIKRIIFEYDSLFEGYQRHQRFFEELEESIEIIQGGMVLEKTLKEVRINKISKKKSIQAYARLSSSLQMLCVFYNQWNVERHETYKKKNCKRLLIDVIDRLKTYQYVLLLKLDSTTSFSDVESQLGTIKGDKAMVCDSKVLEGDYYIGLEIDGVVIQKGCSVRDIYNILWDGFSYLPVTKLAVKEY